MLIHKGFPPVKHSGPVGLQRAEVLGKPGQAHCETAAFCRIVLFYLINSKSLKTCLGEITGGIGHLLPLVPLKQFLVLCLFFGLFSFFFFENIAPHAPYVKKVTGKRHKPAWFWRQERPRLDIYLCCWRSEALCLLQCHGPTAAPAAPRWEAFVEKVFPLALSRLLVVPSACWSKKRVRQGSRCQAFRAAAYFSAWGRGQVFATLECKM